VQPRRLVRVCSSIRSLFVKLGQVIFVLSSRTRPSPRPPPILPQTPPPSPRLPPSLRPSLSTSSSLPTWRRVGRSQRRRMATRRGFSLPPSPAPFAYADETLAAFARRIRRRHEPPTSVRGIFLAGSDGGGSARQLHLPVLTLSSFSIISPLGMSFF